jgi:hypothetical protein
MSKETEKEELPRISEITSSALLDYDSIWLTNHQPLVVLSGCENIHQNIADNIPRTHNFYFKTLPLQYAFPEKKPTRSFENYDPPGILKIAWMKKRLHIFPTVFVLLVEWSDGSDETNEANITTAVNQFKNNNQSRHIQILSVAVRHRNTADEDPTLEDRVARAGKRAGLEHKVFLLTTTDFKNSLRRLETILWDVCSIFCKKEIQRIKSHKSRVKADSQTKLVIRHHFKIAFYSELSQDSQAALKYYQSCSTALKQIGVSSQGELLLEYKWIAYILMVKICRLLLKMQTIQRAFAFFQSHLSDYQSLSPFGSEQLEFLDHDWTSRQYYAFGRILQDIKTMNNRQYNPGYFYLTAGSQSSKRKGSAKEAKVNVAKRRNINLAPNRPLIGPEYVGQSCLLKDLEPRIAQTGRAAAVIESHLYVESRVNHSNIVIKYLSESWEQFKQEQQRGSAQELSNIQLHLLFMTGVEQFSESNWAQARLYFQKLQNVYREGGWYQLLTQVLIYLYKCARSLKGDPITLSFELLASYTTLNLQQRRILLSDVFLYLSEAPVATPPAETSKSSQSDSHVIPLERKKALILCDYQFLADFDATAKWSKAQATNFSTNLATLHVADPVVLLLRVSVKFLMHPSAYRELLSFCVDSVWNLPL